MKKVLSIFLTGCFILTAYSQTNPVPADSIQPNTIKQWKEKLAFVNSSQFKLNGYGQAYYLATDGGEINNTMRVNRIILFATGSLINPKFTYMLMYDFGHKPGLHEYYGEYTPCIEGSFRFGQFKVPFTLENPMSPTKWEGIFATQSVNALAGGVTDVIGPKAGRDMGAMISGKLFRKKDFYQIEYYAGLFNGTGFNTPEDNNHKDFAGTLILQPVKGLKLAGSGYSGKALYTMPDESTPSNHVRNRWSVGGEYTDKHWYARSEYLYGNDGGIDRNGYYAIGMWKILPDALEVFGKYDYYNPDKSSKSADITEYTAGINYYVGYLSRIQLNYIRTENGIKPVNTLAAQVQIFF